MTDDRIEAACRAFNKFNNTPEGVPWDFEIDAIRAAITAYHAAPEAKPAQVGVKPLEWSTTGDWRWTETTGRYTINENRGQWFLYGAANPALHGPYNDYEDAMAAAQSDSALRIEAAAEALCRATGLDWDTIPDAAEGDNEDTGPETRRDFRRWVRPAITAYEAAKNPPANGVAWYALHSKTGVHVGLWADKSIPERLLADYPGGTITTLYSALAATARGTIREMGIGSDKVEAETRAAYRAKASGELDAPRCCMCGKIGLSTTEGDGGGECELADGRWVCSQVCYDLATELLALRKRAGEVHLLAASIRDRQPAGNPSRLDAQRILELTRPSEHGAANNAALSTPKEPS